MKYAILALAVGMTTLQATAALCAPASASLRAGAARIDITPSKSQLPKGYDGINDPIYARAAVLEHNGRKAALVTVDIGAMSDATWMAVARGAQSLGIPSANLMLTATHSHSVPRAIPQLDEKIIEALRQAEAKLRPATIAYGQGVSHININRNIIDPKTRRWWEGPNYEGPSDKTVGVISITSASGEPIAVYYNYAVHAVVNGQLDQVSGDIPGAASRYIEDSLGDGAVAIWSEGAAGDQNPIFFQQTYDLRNIRIAEYAKRGEDISNAMPPGGRGARQERSAGRSADGAAAADRPVDGATPGGGGLARRTRRARPAGDQSADLWRDQDGRLSGAREDRHGPGWLSGNLCRWAGGADPSELAQDRRDRDRRGERRGVQPDRPAFQGPERLKPDDDGDLDQRPSADGLYSS